MTEDAGGVGPAFVVTTPLQLIVAMTLREQVGGYGRAHLYAVNGFFDSETIFSRVLEYDPGWASISLFGDRMAAIRACAHRKHEQVFVDSDVGVRIYLSLLALKLRRPATRVAVYEEGIGTYRTDLYPSAKAALLSLAGVGTRFGGSNLTSSTWVYHVDEFERRLGDSRAIRIEPPLLDFIASKASLLESLFASRSLEDAIPLASGESCSLYLSNWRVDPTILPMLKARGGPRFLKLHPHAQNPGQEFTEAFDHSFPASLPAELLIAKLATRFSHVAVFHHGSSASTYVSQANVEFIDLRSLQLPVDVLSTASGSVRGAS
jgi:hypothetical protein